MREDEASVLSGAYATDALSEAESAEFESALARNEQLGYETTELVDTAVMLGLSVEPVEPRPELKARIMALIDSTPQLESDREPEHEIVVETPPTEVEDLPLAARMRWFQRPAAVVLGAAAAIAVITGALVGGAAASSSHQQQLAVSAYSSVSNADDARTTTARVAGGGTATVAWSSSHRTAAVKVAGVPTPAAGSVYELWYINADGARAAGTFYPVGGTGARVLKGEMITGDTIGITVEPTGGSQQPTSEPVMAMPTSA